MGEAAEWALAVLCGWTALGLPMPRVPPVGGRLASLRWWFRVEASGGVGPARGCRCDEVKPLAWPDGDEEE